MADQFSMEIQRPAGRRTSSFRIGYVGTLRKGPLPDARRQPAPAAGGTKTGRGVDPTRGIIRLRANTAESWYHSLQTGLDKRFSDGLSAGACITPGAGTSTPRRRSSIRRAVKWQSHRIRSNIEADKAVFRLTIGRIG